VQVRSTGWNPRGQHESGAAGPDRRAGDTDWSEGLMPFPDEIDTQDEFTTSPIDAREFEHEWLAAPGRVPRRC